MHQAVITLEQFADLWEELEQVMQVDIAGVKTTSARHPALGAVVAIQDIQDDMILLSQKNVEALQRYRRLDNRIL
ncbi:MULTISPECIES: hypothetical protein [unclassified Beijerinckia]|uniref:hypothetical protein n=1 Tax=unclassified Beijerinckia TaxID=2638183 RepID=UPI00089982EA|nr:MULTISPECIES: hypothetical protein [unclassified Beijerinckia]MDH7795807.1 hypothetical protein [Beijerinckia sp. GAS462]SEC17218.1 hypothetical protein SAMN05443249_2085 [Beijerinckia sp. 28-YEA-48]